jgi:hypothetical protein
MNDTIEGRSTPACLAFAQGVNIGVCDAYIGCVRATRAHTAAWMEACVWIPRLGWRLACG